MNYAKDERIKIRGRAQAVTDDPDVFKRIADVRYQASRRRIARDARAPARTSDLDCFPGRIVRE